MRFFCSKKTTDESNSIIKTTIQSGKNVLSPVANAFAREYDYLLISFISILLYKYWPKINEMILDNTTNI